MIAWPFGKYQRCELCDAFLDAGEAVAVEVLDLTRFIPAVRHVDTERCREVLA